MSDHPILVVDGELVEFNNDIAMHYDVGDPDCGQDMTLTIKLTHEGIIVDLIDNCVDGSEIIASRAWTALEMSDEMIE